MKYASCPHVLNELLRKPIPLRDFRSDRGSILENGNFEVNDSISPSGRAEVSHDLYNQMQMGSFGTVPGQGSNKYRNLFFAYMSTMKEQSKEILFLVGYVTTNS